MSANLYHGPLIDLSDHHSALRDSVAKVMANYGRSYFQGVVKRGERPDALWAALGDAGFLGVHIPEEHGGGGGGLADYYVVIEEVAAHGSPLLALVINSICAPIIGAFGSDQLKREWLPGLASGRKRMAFSITEPNAGSNTHQISTTVRETADGWLLQGSKYWTSAIDESEAVLVVARDEARSTPERSALSLFIVPTDAKGLSWQPIDSALSVPEKQFTVFYDGIELPREALIGGRGGSSPGVRRPQSRTRRRRRNQQRHRAVRDRPGGSVRLRSLGVEDPYRSAPGRRASTRRSLCRRPVRSAGGGARCSAL